jgi:shikimate kinase
MGSGKTSVGKALACVLGWRFHDLDVEIEKREQRKVRDIFRDEGEARFRQIEAETLGSVLADAPRPLVLATGGGTFVQAENLKLLRSAGAMVVYLHAPAEVLLRRCCAEPPGSEEAVRPLARDRESFLRLYGERLPFYRNADFTFDSDAQPPSEVAREIAAALKLGG